MELNIAKNLAIDSALIERAFKLSGESTYAAAVNQALKEFITLREQQSIIELFGTLDLDVSLNHNLERSRKKNASR